MAGKIGWIDITVDDADGLRDFYMAVAGWQQHDVEMDGYADYTMLSDDGEPAGGICHARGENAGLPAQWLIYITVPDIDAAMREVTARGGEIISGPRRVGDARMCVFRDPAGAVAALYQG